jgi:uncharacterized protein YjbI with pentapeptide repeats
MAIRWEKISGADFMDGILAGRRDFSEIELEEGADLSGHPRFQDMNASLLRKANEGASPGVTRGELEKHPIILRQATLIGIKAKRLYLPYVDASCAYFRDCDFSNACFYEGDFYGAFLNNVNLRGARLTLAKFENAHFVNMDLPHQEDPGKNPIGRVLLAAGLY